MSLTVYMTENKEIPENADKILFAEDLINHVLGHTIDTSYSTVTAKRYRDFICSAFNETIEVAVTVMHYNFLVQRKYSLYCTFYENPENLTAYTMYAEKLRKIYLTDVFNPGAFLHFCVSLAGAAKHCYERGIHEAPNLAVTYIVNALHNVDMKNGGWDMLNTVGRKFAKREYDSLNETPHDSPVPLKRQRCGSVSSRISDEETSNSSWISDEGTSNSSRISDEETNNSSRISDEETNNSSWSTDEETNNSSWSTDEETNNSSWIFDEETKNYSWISDEGTKNYSWIYDEDSNNSLCASDEDSNNSSSTSDKEANDSSFTSDEGAHDSSSTSEDKTQDCSFSSDKDCNDTSSASDEDSNDSSSTSDREANDSSSTSDKEANDSSFTSDEVAHDSSSTSKEETQDCSFSSIEETHNSISTLGKGDFSPNLQKTDKSGGSNF